MNYGVVIVAAGQGKRMNAGKNKLLLIVKEEPVIVHTIRLFEKDEWCTQIILVVNKNEREVVKDLVNAQAFKKVKAYVEGGSERQHSVKNGLEAIQNEHIVLVHDGARPFVSQPVIHTLVETVAAKGAATLAVAVKDTIKRVKENKVKETLNRNELWAIQTPQAFSQEMLMKAHLQAEREGFLGTDDASLVEWLGEEVFIVEGEYHNIKLTTPEDLAFAEAIIKEKENKS